MITTTALLGTALAVISDWLIFERLFQGGMVVAHGEEPPHYRDYVGLRLVLLVAGVLVGVAANNWRPPNALLVWAGFAVGFGAQLYALADGLRDVIKPRNRRL